MHCLIIEDRKLLASGFTQMVENLRGIEAVHTAMHPYEIRYLLKTVPISVVICSPDLWNHEYFKEIKSMPRLIFLSNTRSKIKEDVEGSQLVVLKEPFSPLHLERLVDKVMGQDTTFFDFMFVKFERRWRPIQYADIELVEKKPGSYVLIATRKCNYLVSGTLQSWLRKLPMDRFVRPCDSLVVPMTELPKFTGDVYVFRGREIRLTFRMAKKAKREMESLTQHF